MPIVFDGNGNIISGSDAAISIADDGLVSFIQGIKIAASKGINFSAYGSGVDSNLLDDYEEGTWTPEYRVASGANFTSVTYRVTTYGRYVKIGRTVWVEGQLETDAITKGSATGSVLVVNFPFTTNNIPNRHSIAVVFVNNFLGDHPSSIELIGNNTNGYIHYRTAANGSTNNILQVSDLDTGSNKNVMRFKGFYTT